ncbi:hypothetical protein BpHYR1_047348 [Brachionus plicatilis]|uniref:Uncharacterized protein n=1 Tax=Brachionus plicatilis TaxID=10195 RepID=A0A3M7SQ73_BRAPC|nr:hypothetical protein BpHYR1_047348 [Brachionus plicatilis]
MLFDLIFLFLNFKMPKIKPGQVPKSWKIASITMIPKKSSPTQGHNNLSPDGNIIGNGLGIEKDGDEYY